MDETSKITADDASDLKSLIQRVEQTALLLKDASEAKALADQQLESWLYSHTKSKN